MSRKKVEPTVDSIVEMLAYTAFDHPQINAVYFVVFTTEGELRSCAVTDKDSIIGMKFIEDIQSHMEQGFGRPYEKFMRLVEHPDNPNKE